MHQHCSLSSHLGHRGDPTGTAVGGEKRLSLDMVPVQTKVNVMVTSQQCSGVVLKSEWRGKFFPNRPAFWGTGHPFCVEEKSV